MSDTPIARARAALAVEFRATFDGPSLVAVPVEDLRALIEFAEAWKACSAIIEIREGTDRLLAASDALFGEGKPCPMNAQDAARLAEIRALCAAEGIPPYIIEDSVFLLRLYDAAQAEAREFRNEWESAAEHLRAAQAERDACARRLLSLAKNDDVRCHCEATAGYKHVCEACRALTYATALLAKEEGK